VMSVPQYECALHGAVSEENFFGLLERLRGLCYQESPLYYREIVYKSLPVPGVAQSELHVRCTGRDPKWELRYVGTGQFIDKINATIKHVVDVDVSDNVCTFVELLGFKSDYEYFVQGYKFKAPKMLDVTVAQIKKSEKGQMSPLDLFNKMWFVELSCTTTDSRFPQASDCLSAFQECLHPYVEMYKLDHRTLGDASVTTITASRPTATPSTHAQTPITITPHSFTAPASPRASAAAPTTGYANWHLKKEPNAPAKRPSK